MGIDVYDDESEWRAWVHCLHDFQFSDNYDGIIFHFDKKIRA